MMSSKLVLDTHALICFIEGNPKLGSFAKARLAEPDAELLLPAMALAEACWIVNAGRTGVPSAEALLEAIDEDERIVVVPMDRKTITTGLSLGKMGEIHDQLIAAVVAELIDEGADAALVTRDNAITKSGLVPVVW